MTKHPEVIATLSKLSDRPALLNGEVVVCETYLGRDDVGAYYWYRYVDPETLQPLRDKKTGKELCDPKTMLPLSAFFRGPEMHQATEKEKRAAGRKAGLHEVRTGK